MSNFELLEGSKSPHFLKEYIIYMSSKNNEFPLNGLLLFTGSQGSGKTYKAVEYVYNIKKKYPQCSIVSNLNLEFQDYEFKNQDDLHSYSNYGTVILIDEIQIYFNSLSSKNIDPVVMAQIAQQRKQHIHIVATTQVFGRLAKQFREQFNQVVYCSKFFGLNCIGKIQLIDRYSMDGENSTDTNLSGKVLYQNIFFRNPEIFDMYDTYKIIDIADRKGGVFNGYDE